MDAWNADVASGNFQLTSHWSNGGITPYNMYDGWLDQTAVLEPIAKYVAANLPVIPTTTGSQWFQYNSQNYTGWPTPDNPYHTGQPSGTNNGPGSGTNEVVLLHLRPQRSGVNKEEPPVLLRPAQEEGGPLERIHATSAT